MPLSRRVYRQAVEYTSANPDQFPICLMMG
jgi:hypothetical protein